jgi:hypothetical protein
MPNPRAVPASSVVRVLIVSSVLPWNRRPHDAAAGFLFSLLIDRLAFAPD